MNTFLIQLLSAWAGSLGFALLFGLRRRYLFAASLGGLLSCAICLGLDALLYRSFVSNLAASAFAVVYAEILARRLRCPATLFVVPAIISLVPGGGLYDTLRYAVYGQAAQARLCGAQTLKTAVAIAAGISLTLAWREILTRPRSG